MRPYVSPASRLAPPLVPLLVLMLVLVLVLGTAEVAGSEPEFCMTDQPGE